MDVRAYCRIPKYLKKSVRAKEGSCPELLYDLFSELEGASEIHIAAYLFNNPTYFNFLSGLAKKGCKVFITSLPIRGYSDKELKVEGYEKKVSGRSLAEEVYNAINETENMELFIFPHQYSWYGALYAGGGASYSFHVKSIFAKFPENKNKCILSSGNFMVSDPPHSENMIVIENNPEYESVYSMFFNELEKLAIPFKDFQNNYSEYKDEFLYQFSDKIVDLPSKGFKNCFFTAPFYCYDGKGSNHFAGDRIIELISNAKKRVWICAQHFHDLVSFDTERETIIGAIYKKYLDCPDLEFRFLKQVPHSSLADKRRAAIAETLFQFEIKAEQRYNNLIHDKFIIVDDTLIVSTANYTSTQFAYGKRRMEYKEGKDKFRKDDIFSEVNGFIILNNCPKKVMRTYEQHFNALWNQGVDIKINL